MCKEGANLPWLRKVLKDGGAYSFSQSSQIPNKSRPEVSVRLSEMCITHREKGYGYFN
jgi:hypothetical protein